MAERPDKLPEWATVDEIDPVSGQSNVVEPPPERKESGWTRREIPPRQWFNWLARYYKQWIEWARDILDAATNIQTPDTIAKRDASGRMRAADPVDLQDVVTLGFVADPANYNLSQDGYYRLPGGLVLQWVSAIVTVGTNIDDEEIATINLPTTSFSSHLQAGCMQGPRGDDLEGSEVSCSVRSVTSTSISLLAKRISGGNTSGTEEVELVGFMICKE